MLSHRHRKCGILCLCKKECVLQRRYLSKGTANVLAESTVLAIARNINKLHNKIQNGKTGTHLFPLKSAVEFYETCEKRIIKREDKIS